MKLYIVSSALYSEDGELSLGDPHLFTTLTDARSCLKEIYESVIADADGDIDSEDIDGQSFEVRSVTAGHHVGSIVAVDSR